MARPNGYRHSAETRQLIKDIARKRNEFIRDTQKTKKCSMCGEVKQISDFIHYTKSFKVGSYCKPCRNKKWMEWHNSKSFAEKKDRRLRNDFGITLDEYHDMFERQEGLCAICGEPQRRNRLLAVDHNHKTGEVRALLCDSCNTALGYAKDNPIVIRRMADYIEKYGGA